ncbi:hypothetical protein MFUR16E_08155 [Methylobacterium fujisawaense]|uniref:hypothetical protein n=1 Tax=Methylobacterium fujisawaense TaxID=107400 RepID=UPI002F2DAFB4
MPAEPRAPKALADPEALAARRALIDSPHIAPIRALAAVAAAAPYLAPLLDLLPRLAVAVLAGRFAGEAAPALAALRPDLPVIRVPHPSPTYVCTAPEVPERIRRGLAEAAAILDRTSG